MTIRGERIGRSTTKAFATPWAVCRNVAYPPPSKFKNTNITQGEGQHIPRGQRPSCEAGASGVTRNASQVSFLFSRI